MVTICGENFHLEVDGVAKRVGFYTVRYVEARDEEDAERRAYNSVQQNEWLGNAVRNDQDDQPMLFADDIEELASFDDIDEETPGFAFFNEK